MNDLRKMISTYRESLIQSEAEVRTKFIIPLLCVLGYPEKYRAEEYPVHGYGGREKLPAKDADFILFSDENFASHRADTQKNNIWVQEHSLLVVEAKKPGKMPDVLGQAQYYTMWTKAVAYIETDGEQLKAFIYNRSSSDFEVIDARVDDLPDNNSIMCLSYKSLKKIKEDGSLAFQNEIQNTIEKGIEQVITKDEDLCLPNETIEYMRLAMGRNALGWSNVQLVNSFISSTELYLNNDLRYDIPKYMIDFPRKSYEAHMYLNNDIFPLSSGKVTEFYRNEEVRYLYESEYFQALAIYINDKLSSFELGYRVWDQRVSERIKNFQLVEKFLYSEQINISIEKKDKILLQLPSGKPGKLWTKKKHDIEMFRFWLSGMNKLKAIEEYYEIEFKLGVVKGDDELDSLYQAIDFVYDGIMLNDNCNITLPGDLFDEKLNIDEPFLLEENANIPLKSQTIQNVVFKPYRSAVLPGKYDFRFKTKDDIVTLSGCVEYQVEQVLF